MSETLKLDSVKIESGPNLVKTKYFRLIAVSIVLVGTLLFLVIDSNKDRVSTKCGDYSNDKVVKISGENLNAEVASTNAKRTVGLGGRPCILPGQAMLFVFDKTSQYAMWMKDMNFPIDIIWISADHRAVSVERNVEPSTYRSTHPYFTNDSNHLAKYVLEIKANRSSELGIGLGTPISF